MGRGCRFTLALKFAWPLSTVVLVAHAIMIWELICRQAQNSRERSHAKVANSHCTHLKDSANKFGCGRALVGRPFVLLATLAWFLEYILSRSACGRGHWEPSRTFLGRLEERGGMAICIRLSDSAKSLDFRRACGVESCFTARAECHAHCGQCGVLLGPYGYTEVLSRSMRVLHLYLRGLPLRCFAALEEEPPGQPDRHHWALAHAHTVSHTHAHNHISRRARVSDCVDSVPQVCSRCHAWGKPDQ
jgi:hypothetical protein